MVVLIRPTPSTYLVRGWSTTGAGHRGIDYGFLIANPAETQKITAAADGTVIDVYTGTGYNGGWGRRIRVDHGHGNVTTYNHIRPGGVLVSPGQKVSAGQLLALMGSSGAATGVHLHFELYINGVRVDPAPYFSKALPGTEGGGTSGAGTPAPAGGQTFTVPNGGQYYYWQYNNALNGNYASNQLLRGGQTLEVVENPGTGPVRVRCADGDLVWVGTRKHPAPVSGGGASPAPAPAPATKAYIHLETNWYYYESEADARAARNLKKWAPPGNHLIVGGSGPYYVYIGALGRNVWVGSSKTNPPVVHL